MDYKFAEREAVSCTVSRKGIACKVQILTHSIRLVSGAILSTMRDRKKNTDTVP